MNKIIQRLWRQCHINHNHNLNFTEPIYKYWLGIKYHVKLLVFDVNV